VDNLTASHVSSLPEGARQAECLDPNRVKNRVIRQSSNGAAYAVDGAGVRHAIADGETWYCMLARLGPAVDNLTASHVSSLPEGARQAECLDPNRVKNKVVRESGGTAYFVDSAGLWHWIADGGVYLCLTARYPLINNVTWNHINSIRVEGNWATC
jgi:hypothetical protein